MELQTYLVNNGMLSQAAQDAEIKKLAARFVAAGPEDANLSDKEKAQKVIDMDPSIGTEIATGDGMAMPALTAADNAKLMGKIRSEQEARQNTSNEAQINAYIFAHDGIDVVVPGALQGVMDKEKIAKFKEKYEKLIVPEYTSGKGENARKIDSLANMKQIQALADAGTPVDVIKPSKSTRAIGYTVVVGGATQMLTRSKMLDFLVANTVGYIKASDGRPGLVIAKSRSTTKAGAQKQFLLRDKNKAEALAAKAYEFAAAATSTTKAKSMRVDLPIAVRATNKDGSIKRRADGTEVIRLVYPTATATVPVFKRTEKFVPVFGSDDVDRLKAFKDAPNEEKIAEIFQLTTECLLQSVAEAANSTEVNVGSKYLDVVNGGSLPNALV